MAFHASYIIDSPRYWIIKLLNHLQSCSASLPVMQLLNQWTTELPTQRVQPSENSSERLLKSFVYRLLSSKVQQIQLWREKSVYNLRMFGIHFLLIILISWFYLSITSSFHMRNGEREKCQKAPVYVTWEQTPRWAFNCWG